MILASWQVSLKGKIRSDDAWIYVKNVRGNRMPQWKQKTLENKMKPTFSIILKFCHYSQMRCDLSMLPREGSVCLPVANELEFEDKCMKPEFEDKLWKEISVHQEYITNPCVL